MMRSIGAAAAGIEARLARFNRAAEKIAGGDGEFVANVVDMKTAEVAVAAQVKVIRAAEEMERSLLHVIA